jgi:hypothetical protein
LIRLPKLLQVPPEHPRQVRIVDMPDYQVDLPDMMGPAYILFGRSGGEFAFGCIIGTLHGTAKGDAIEFTWSGDDEMEEACGDGWVELHEDGTPD